MAVVLWCGGPTDTKAPRADGEASLADFAIAMPTTLHGHETLRVRNDGKQPHELTMFRIDDGQTSDDVMAAMHADSPPPATPAGGLGAIAPGATGYLPLDLAPGTYVALCFVPDPATGKAHAAVGMMGTFTVA